MPTDSIRPHHCAARILSEMCAEFGLPEPEEFDLEAIEVKGVTSDHRSVESGDIFVAIGGAQAHGADYLDSAIESGAVAVITDAAGAARAGQIDVPLFQIDDPRLALGHVAQWVYRTDPQAPRLLGIAGAIGKTSTSSIAVELFDQLGVAAGASTSISRRVDAQHTIATLTTPEADDLHALVARMREVGDRVAVIEVSSHALRGQRLGGLEFEMVGPFTHIDGEPGAEEFFELHRELLDPEVSAAAVINIDSAVGRDLVESARIPVATLSSRPDSNADWVVQWQRSGDGVEFTVRGHDDREVRARISKPGQLAALNAASAIVMIAESGWATEQIQDALDRTGGLEMRIPGRLERVTLEVDAPDVFIDVDARPSAVRAALESVQEGESAPAVLVVHPAPDADPTDIAALGELGHDPLIETGDIAEVSEALQEASRRAGREGRILFIEPRADALRSVEEGHLLDPTVELVRDALADAGW